MANWPYNTTAWRKLRAAKLKAAPLCEHCRARGQLKAANAVDHNTPIAKGGEPFPALEDLTSLCERCHNEKTATHDRGQAKPFARRFKGFDAEGNPVDKSDAWHGGGASDHGKGGRGRTVWGIGRYLVSDSQAIETNDEKGSG